MPARTRSPASGHKATTRALERDGFEREHVMEIQSARMITAMIDVVAERGRAGATVAHVVARSGVSRRTFYEVFDGFEDCFLAALDRSIGCASDYVLDDYDPSQKWRVRIRTALVDLLEFLEDEPAMGRLCIVETLGAGPRVHERRARTVEAMIAAVDEARREPKTTSALPRLTTEGIVGGVLSVLHARLLEGSSSLLALTGSLMGMIVLPYFGPAAARKESERPVPRRRRRARTSGGDPLRGLEMRLTYRTMRVLLAIAELGAHGPPPSNREIGGAAGIGDQGQISKLLSRLEKLGLVENSSPRQVGGASNAWTLTRKGFEVERLVFG